MYSVKVIEKIGEPYRIELELTAKTELKRDDYLGHLAKFTVEPPPQDWLRPTDKTEARTFDGCLTQSPTEENEQEHGSNRNNR